MSPRPAASRWLAVVDGRWGRIVRYSVGGILVLWVLFALGYPVAFEWYTGVTNPRLTYPNSKSVTPQEFDRIAAELTHEARLRAAEAATKTETTGFSRRIKIQLRMAVRSAEPGAGLDHIGHFRDAGILRYEGPATCLKCHRTMKVRDAAGCVRTAAGVRVVNTLDDVVDTMHFKFQAMAGGFTTVGYDGREVNAKGRPIPVGKIDRACGIPGSFSWTGWAALIRSKPARKQGETVVRSEGCGQCHVGGNTHPATEKMMPIGDVPARTKQGIDCLICHSRAYDMNERFVVAGKGGRRWNQDRSLKAALAAGKPTSDNCLLCHQHNMGGDLYPANAAGTALGRQHQRLLHAGAKRGNGFSPASDVHAAAGMLCTDCHIPRGHKIPRGTRGTDLVGNDLPGRVVECENCHTAAPHTRDKKTRAFLNAHVDRVACEACHIKELERNSVVLRDWVHPTWNAEEGIWTPTDVLKSGDPGVGFTFLWFNGYGTFLANALGTNPSAPDAYDPLMNQMTRLSPRARALLEERAAPLARRYGFSLAAYVRAASDTLSQLPPDLLADRRRIVDERLRPVMNRGKSRLYPFKLFNALMYEDMGNKGPFGAMILPFDYSVYDETGDTAAAVRTAIQHPIVKRMYQWPFKVYMMDEFMRYFGVPAWSASFPMAKGKLRGVETHWMRQMGTLMVNHGIQRQGRWCHDCHKAGGVMDFRALGYPPDRAAELEDLPELREGALGER